MSAKTSDWRPGPTVCRCCLNEGCYKDISTEYFWMGKREVYAEMLTEAFDLNIAFSMTNGPNSNSRLICEACISRLRDATEFKRQVQDCEKTFLNYLDPSTSSIAEADEQLPDLEKDVVKLECVKEETIASDDDEDYMPPADMNDDEDDDDDDLDNQPLTKLASKMPKNESLELSESEISIKKTPSKRKSTIKLKETPSKKSKTKKDSTKATASKAVAKTEKKKKENIESRKNAEVVLRYTTAYPFRVHDKWILCVYCLEQYDDPNVFRDHMDQEHYSFSSKIVFHNLPTREFVKADLTNLRCRVCSETLDTLDAAAAHLLEKHKHKIHTDEKIGVMPYLLQKDVFHCAVCKKSVPSLFHLNRHTITHFLSYVCHICGSSYVATTGLLRHVRSKHQQYEVKCGLCSKTFPTIEAKERHRRTQQSCGPYCCTKCNDRFLHWKSRRKHMETVHGETKREFRCADCNITFGSENQYYVHFKLHHSQDYVVCNRCGMKFASHSKLKRHLATHDCA